MDCDTAAADGVYYGGQKQEQHGQEPHRHAAKAEQLLVVRIPHTIFALRLASFGFLAIALRTSSFVLIFLPVSSAAV